MSFAWAVRVDRNQLDSLETLRLVDGAEVCEQGDQVWVRGPKLDDAIAAVLRKHAHARRFWIHEGRQLVRPGHRVPLGYLPAGPWSPLRDWIAVVLPDAGFAGTRPGRVPLRLVRADSMQRENVLCTSIRGWADYGATAPQIRLDRWFFAAAGDGRVVVRGTPLPPLPGVRYVESGGIAVPAGWTWTPAISTAALRSLLQLATDDLVLLDRQGHERIAGDCFVRAGRAAMRATLREFADD